MKNQIVSKKRLISRAEQKRIKGGDDGGIGPVCTGACDYRVGDGTTTIGFCRAMPGAEPSDPCYCYNILYGGYQSDPSCNPA